MFKCDKNNHIEALENMNGVGSVNNFVGVGIFEKTAGVMWVMSIHEKQAITPICFHRCILVEIFDPFYTDGPIGPAFHRISNSMHKVSLKPFLNINSHWWGLHRVILFPLCLVAFAFEDHGRRCGCAICTNCDNDSNVLLVTITLLILWSRLVATHNMFLLTLQDYIQSHWNDMCTPVKCHSLWQSSVTVQTKLLWCLGSQCTLILTWDHWTMTFLSSLSVSQWHYEPVGPLLSKATGRKLIF